MLFPFLDLTKKEKKLARLKTQKGGLGKIRATKKKKGRLKTQKGNLCKRSVKKRKKKKKNSLYIVYEFQ